MVIFSLLSAPQIMKFTLGLKTKFAMSHQENKTSTNRDNPTFFEIIAGVL